MKIGIDIDNVITNTTECVINYINKRLDLGLKLEDITEYWLEKVIPPQYGWIVNQAFSDSEMWKNVWLIDDAKRSIPEIIREGHKVYFVTSTTSDNFRKKIKFLQRELDLFPGYAERNTISIKNKQLLQLDILVDDCLENLTGDRTYLSLCYDYPWNRNFVDYSEENFLRVFSWQDIYDIIKRKTLEMQGLFK